MSTAKWQNIAGSKKFFGRGVSKNQKKILMSFMDGPQDKKVKKLIDTEQTGL